MNDSESRVKQGEKGWRYRKKEGINWWIHLPYMPSTLSWVYSSSDQQRKMNFMKDKTESSTRFLRERFLCPLEQNKPILFCSVTYVRRIHTWVCREGEAWRMLDTLGPTDLKRKRLCFKYLPLLQNSWLSRHIYIAVLEEDSRDWAAQGGMRGVILNKVQTLEHEIRLVISAMCHQILL